MANTVRFQGGGHKRRYRLIDFKRDKYEVPAKELGSNMIQPLSEHRIAAIRRWREAIHPRTSWFTR